jgi:shikimate kinase
LKGQAEAISHGAATIINAIATGYGAAVGVDLWTRARVKLTSESRIIDGKIMSDSTEDPVLIEKTVSRVLRYFNREEEFGARVEVWSNIPIARGLKSSSAAGNAIALASVAALDESLDDLAIVNLGVDGAIDANVTITGAFDDACACYFGGVVITDNSRRKIIKRFEMNEDLTVLFYVPPEKAYKANSNVHRMKAVTSVVETAYFETLKGNCWRGLTLNGLICSSALGYNPAIAIDALEEGAFAAGLSGTGPAVAAIVTQEKKDGVKRAWGNYDGEILEARFNNKKARIMG